MTGNYIIIPVITRSVVGNIFSAFAETFLSAPLAMIVVVKLTECRLKYPKCDPPQKNQQKRDVC
jgi:p-aminobenzoyl-glutamate transporter AbgT